MQEPRPGESDDRPSGHLEIKTQNTKLASAIALLGGSVLNYKL
jgi:hypothetical protein